MADDRRTGIGTAVESADGDCLGQAHQRVVEMPERNGILADDAAAGIDGDESINSVTAAKTVVSRLAQAHHAPDGKRDGLVARQLAAPRCPVGIGASVNQAHCGVVIVEQRRARHVTQPERGMGALACAAPAHEKIGLAPARHGGGMDGHRLPGKYGLGIDDPEHRREDKTGTPVLPPQAGGGGGKPPVHRHDVGERAADELDAVALRRGVEAQAAHVVLGLFQQHHLLRLIRMPDGECEQQTTLIHTVSPESPERGQKPAGIGRRGQGDGDGEAGYGEVVC